MTRGASAWVVLLAGLVGCTEANQRLCGDDLRCADPTTPFCDREAVFGETRNSCLAIQCAPGEGLACRDNQLYTCNAAGDSYDVGACELGCADDTRCSEPELSNAVTMYLAVAAMAPAVTLIDGDIIVVASDEVRNGSEVRLLLAGITMPIPGATLRIYPVSGLRVTGEVQLRGTGAGTPSVVFVAAGDVEIDGTLALTGAPGSPPPGGGQQSNVGTAEMFGGYAVGGGGAGFSTPGAPGGPLRDLPARPGGSQFPNPTLEPLRGGYDGGWDRAAPGNVVSRGGGALQISSATRISITDRGFIDANGLVASEAHAPASGGGSGGALLLEAPIVGISDGGVLRAIGVAGASGDGGRPAPPGRSLVSVALECLDSYVCTAGGNGGGSSPPQSPPPEPPSFPLQAGAGGGAAGYIRVNTASGTFDIGNASVVPAPLRGPMKRR